MSEQALTLTLSFTELQELDRLSAQIQHVGPEFVRNRNQQVVYAGRKWTHDDYLQLSVRWYKLAKKAGIDTTQTRKWLQQEHQALKRLGVTLD